jgi:RND family efflux transporter MFP subunit
MSIERQSLLGLALLASLALSGCERAAAPVQPPALAEHVTTVRVGEVIASDAQRQLRLPGVVRAVNRAEPAFLAPGHLAERYVVRGERVVTGQRLASLQNPALAPAFAAAEARVRELDERLVQLDADYERARELNRQGLASAELLDRTLAERNATRQARVQALARASEAREQLADAMLRAPFDATVSDLLVEPGDFVMAGQPVMVLAGDGRLEVEVQLPEGLSRRLAPGAPATVRAVGSGKQISARIREIGVPREGRPAPAIVELEESPDWEPGLSVHVDLAQHGPAALTVPLSAIVDPGTGQTRVYRVVNDRAEMVSVNAGRLLGARVEVTGALAAGDRVVIAGHQQLLDGDAVRVLP